MRVTGRFGAGVGHDGGWNEAQGQPQPGGKEQQVIQVAQHGNEVGDQVDGTQGVGQDQEREGAGVPGRARVAGGVSEGQQFGFQALGRFFQAFQHLLHDAAQVGELRLHGGKSGQKGE